MRFSRTIWLGCLLLAGLLWLAACAMPAAQTASQPQASAAGTIETVQTGAPHGTASELLPAEAPPNALLNSPWATDFDRRTVEWSEIRSGGPRKDGIPAIDNPEFESVDAAAQWLAQRDPVILFSLDEDVRAYPLAILIWHEIVNDRVGGRHVTVTFCPLCNASIVFDREFDDLVLDFGTTGLLRNSDLIMYDRQTETWWQQFTGQGIVGEYAGEHLDFLAAQVISFGDFAAQFPQGRVLARPAEARSYGSNPYTQYDSTAGRPFLFDGELDQRLPATARVVGLIGTERALAYPFSTVAAAQVINTEWEETPLVIFHRPGAASALDTHEISEGRDIGSIGVFERQVGDLTLTFAPSDEYFVDTETGSRWNHLGEAVAGELAGTTLVRQLAFDHFWFAWAAFFPETELIE